MINKKLKNKQLGTMPKFYLPELLFHNFLQITIFLQLKEYRVGNLRKMGQIIGKKIQSK